VLVTRNRSPDGGDIVSLVAQSAMRDPIVPKSGDFHAAGAIVPGFRPAEIGKARFAPRSIRATSCQASGRRPPFLHRRGEMK
jgi:hypothetical protein